MARLTETWVNNPQLTRTFGGFRRQGNIVYVNEKYNPQKDADGGDFFLDKTQHPWVLDLSGYNPNAQAREKTEQILASQLTGLIKAGILQLLVNR